MHLHIAKCVFKKDKNIIYCSKKCEQVMATECLIWLTAFSFLTSSHTVSYIMWILVPTWIFHHYQFSCLQPATYFYIHVDMGGKKRKSSASGGSDRLPQPPPHVTPGSGVWRSALPTCSPSHDPRRRKKPPRRATQMGRSRVQTLVSPLHWLISTWCRYSQQEPGWDRQFIHEKCIIEAILAKRTHSLRSWRKQNKVE